MYIKKVYKEKGRKKQEMKKSNKKKEKKKVITAATLKIGSVLSTWKLQ